MMNIRPSPLPLSLEGRGVARYALGFLVVLALPAPAFAQEPGVELRLDTRVLELGEAVDVQVVCRDTARPDAPQAAVPDGLDLKLLNSNPMSSSFTQIINGRTSQQTTYTYPMRLTALKEGTYTLGPITVVAGGTTYRTEPVQIVVRKSEVTSAARGDKLVFAELDVQPRSLYVTQAYVARLTFGIRKVEIGGRILNFDLLRDVLDQGASQLSTFAGSSDVRRTESRIPDSGGVSQAYEIFYVTKEVRAEQVGEALVGPVFLRVNYPTAVRRGFFGGTEVTQARKDSARADAVTVEVKGPPAEGRPDDYTGAIGQFTMRVSVKPTHVEQGQPVTLAVAVQGTPLEGVAGPDLTKQPELVSRFDFTKDELVGDVEGGAKVFRRAIFAKQAGEQTVPPIRWSYFDPRQERYVTLTSDPITVGVDPPSATTTIVLTERPDQEPKGTTLTVLAGGISPNFTDAGLVLADQSFVLSAPWIASLIASPLAWLVVALVTRHRARLRADVGFARRRRAKRAANGRISRALSNSEPVKQMHGLAEAMTGYLCDRFRLPPGTLTPGDARSLLSTRGIDQRTADGIVDLLETCDAMRYAPGMVNSLSAPQSAAAIRGWIRDIEKVTR